jgi:hypothetical protein
MISLQAVLVICESLVIFIKFVLGVLTHFIKMLPSFFGLSVNALLKRLTPVTSVSFITHGTHVLVLGVGQRLSHILSGVFLDINVVLLACSQGDIILILVLLLSSRVMFFSYCVFLSKLLI